MLPEANAVQMSPTKCPASDHLRASHSDWKWNYNATSMCVCVSCHEWITAVRSVGPGPSHTHASHKQPPVMTSPRWWHTAGGRCRSHHMLHGAAWVSRGTESDVENLHSEITLAACQSMKQPCLEPTSTVKHQSLGWLHGELALKMTSFICNMPRSIPVTIN